MLVCMFLYMLQVDIRVSNVVIDSLPLYGYLSYTRIFCCLCSSFFFEVVLAAMTAFILTLEFRKRLLEFIRVDRVTMLKRK